MGEIEKMYENVRLHKCTNIGNFCKHIGATCERCEKHKYPPFTAEKQISILMFILNKFGDIGFQKMYSIRGNDETTRKDFIKCLCDCKHETIDSRPVDFYYQNGANGDNLEESIAGLINTLWQNLSEEEKQQVKGILE